MTRAASILLFAIAMAAASGCASDDPGTPNQGDNDGGVQGDAETLWACETPGQRCNAHNSCAINPICGDDHKCHPASYQKCDDGLDCTTDVCAGLGRCENTPKEGFCAIRAKGGVDLACFAKGDTRDGSPCSICEPEQDALNWSPRTGGSCDDGDACTTDDYCQEGDCRGTSYASECDDGLSCTEDCDGKGGCITPKLKDNVCQIDGQCVSKGGQDPTGCGICDPSRSTTSWSPDGLLCLIDGKCVRSGASHPGGCATCNPTQNAKAWTVAGDACLIEGSCRKPGEIDSLGCGECVPADHKYRWTPISGKCTIEGHCYDKGDPAPKRDCAQCDPGTDPHQWTVIGDSCLIDNTCVALNEADSSGCLSCQPGTDKYGWSPVANKCTIAGSCYDEGAEHPTKCLVCAYARAASFWSIKGSATAKEELFDSGTGLPSGWSEKHDDSAVAWQILSDKRSVSGKGALYYGDPKTGSYLGAGGVHSGEALWEGLAVPPANGGQSLLVFKVFLGIESRAHFDVLAIYVTDKDGKKTMVWDKSKVAAASYHRWVQQVVDLAAYAGQTVKLTFFFHTIDATGNRGEGVYIDDVALVSGC